MYWSIFSMLGRLPRQITLRERIRENTRSSSPTAFIQNTKSSASNSSPSDHFMPGRRCRVKVRSPLDCSQPMITLGKIWLMSGL